MKRPSTDDLIRAYMQSREAQRFLVELAHIQADLAGSIEVGAFASGLDDAVMDVIVLIEGYHELRRLEKVERNKAAKAKAKAAPKKVAKTSVAGNVIKLKVKPKRKPKQ
jgi:hypothetical protein